MKRVCAFGAFVLAVVIAHAAAAQDSKVARIGFLRASPPPERILDAFRRGLAEHGHVEGRSYALVHRWADGNLERLPDLAAALVNAGVDVIVTEGSFTAREARAVTTTIPIVMGGGVDPRIYGLIESLSRPGGNVTGLTTQNIDVSGKHLQQLKEIVPGLGEVAVLAPRGAGVPFQAAQAEAAQALGLRLNHIYMETPEAADAAIRRAVAERAQAAVLRGTPFLSTTQRKLFVERALAHRLPVMYETRDFVELGGLASYGADFTAVFRLAAGYVARILKGAKPGELPVEQASKIELVINLKTAKAIGVTVPMALLIRADELIE
jgi:putative ABC transport system substrate-binding protein